jgi:hypothetical protein
MHPRNTFLMLLLELTGADGFDVAASWLLPSQSSRPKHSCVNLVVVTVWADATSSNLTASEASGKHRRMRIEPTGQCSLPLDLSFWLQLLCVVTLSFTFTRRHSSNRFRQFSVKFIQSQL